MVTAGKVFAKSSPDAKQTIFLIFFLKTGYGGSNLDLSSSLGYLNLGFCHNDIMAFRKSSVFWKQRILAFFILGNMCSLFFIIPSWGD